jgi:hypothetical protein
VADGTAAPVIAGLAIGAGFVFLIGFIGNFPSGFVVSEWLGSIEENQTQIPVVVLEMNDISKYHELERGVSFLDNNPGGYFGEPQYSTWIMEYEARQLMKDFPFVEQQSSQDQFYRGYHVIIKVIEQQEKEGQEGNVGEAKDHNYIVGIYSIKPGRLFDY